MTYAGKSLPGASSAPRSMRLAIWMWVLLFAIAGPAFQQIHAQTTGLTGTVTDSTGAAVVGATVTFRNEANGTTAQVATASDGVYSAQIDKGTWDITVQAKGFQKFEATHVVVEVGATPTFNIKLSVGSASETVQVVSEGALELDTTNPQLDSMLPSVEVTDLPLLINGYMRQITSFATLAPGVRAGPYGSVTVEGGAPSQINSSGNYYNGLQIDTASDTNSNPPYEMVDQFRVIRNLFSARYGMVQGAVDYNMRAGTNKLHGDGFLIDRNQFFDSDGFFPVYKVSGKPIPPANIQSDWGGTIGGPVVLPKVYNGHNKTFFLFSFDLYNWNQGQTAFGSVPTAAEVGGDFSKFVNSNGKLIPIYDPPTGQQFMGCSGTSPTSSALAASIRCRSRCCNTFPHPMRREPTTACRTTRRRQSHPLRFRTGHGASRSNHQLSQNQSISFTWWRNHYLQPQIEETRLLPSCRPTTPSAAWKI